MTPERIYLDYASTTPVLPEVLEAMQPYWSQTFGNPASSHRAGAAARLALESARAGVAHGLGARPEEVIFTSGATEANNLAIAGLAGSSPGVVILSPIEHPSVTLPCERLADLGYSLIRLRVDRHGNIDPQSWPDADPSSLRLAAVQLANHEIGTVQQIAPLRRVAQGAPVHVDATQAVGKIPVDFSSLEVATLACSAHKFHGPKGIGALLIRRGTRLHPLFRGGHQQAGIRPGTEPVPLAIGMAKALQLACEQLQSRRDQCRRRRDRLLQILQAIANPCVPHGDPEGLPHFLNVSFPGCRADLLLIRLDLAGIDCATGSACSSGSLLPSPVLQALGCPADQLHSTIRFSLGLGLSDEAVEEAGNRIAREVQALRSKLE